MPIPAADLEAAAIAVVADRLVALDEYLQDDGPAGCCGECRSCEAAVAVSAAWPVLLVGVLDHLRAVGEVDALTAAGWLERDLAPPT